MPLLRPAPVLAMAAAIGSPAWAADPAHQRIDAYHQAVIAIARQGSKAGLAGRTRQFETVVRDYYDMPAIAALVVGAGWSPASADDRSAVTAALTKHSAVQLANNFKSYSGERFVTDPTVAARGSDHLVRATIGGTPLVYRLRQSGGAWKIIDVLSGGVSQLAVQRSDFASTIATGGAAALAKRLAIVDAKALGAK